MSTSEERRRSGDIKPLSASSQRSGSAPVRWIIANTLLAGNQSFHFAGDNPMFVAEQDLWTRTTLTGTLVEGDVNGDSLADFRILVSGTSSLGQSSFIL